MRVARQRVRARRCGTVCAPVAPRDDRRRARADCDPPTAAGRSRPLAARRGRRRLRHRASRLRATLRRELPPCARTTARRSSLGRTDARATGRPGDRSRVARAAAPGRCDHVRHRSTPTITRRACRSRTGRHRRTTPATRPSPRRRRPACRRSQGHRLPAPAGRGARRRCRSLRCSRAAAAAAACCGATAAVPLRAHGTVPRGSDDDTIGHQGTMLRTVGAATTIIAVLPSAAARRELRAGSHRRRRQRRPNDILAPR